MRICDKFSRIAQITIFTDIDCTDEEREKKKSKMQRLHIQIPISQYECLCATNCINYYSLCFSTQLFSS